MTKRGKGSRIMAVVDARGLPISVGVFTAGEHEVRQAERSHRIGVFGGQVEHGAAGDQHRESARAAEQVG